MNRPLRTMLGGAMTAAMLATVAVAPAQAHPGGRPPAVLALPDGFQPEGIATAGRYAYFGSRATGAIQRVDLVTGRGTTIGAATGTPSLGLKVDPRVGSSSPAARPATLACSTPAPARCWPATSSPPPRRSSTTSS